MLQHKHSLECTTRRKAVVDTVVPSGQACGRREGCAGSPRTLRHTRGHASRTTARGPEGCSPTARVLAALAGVPLRLVVARGLLALQLCEFRVDGAQTPLTGHLLPPPHHVGAPEATGRMLQIGEPSMDGMRHDRPPSPPAWWIAASLYREREWCTHEMLHAWGGAPKAEQPRWPSRRLWRIMSEVP